MNDFLQRHLRATKAGVALSQENPDLRVVRAFVWIGLAIAGIESARTYALGHAAFRDEDWQALQKFALEEPQANVLIDGSWLVDRARYKAPELFSRGETWPSPPPLATYILSSTGNSPTPAAGWSLDSQTIFGALSLSSVRPSAEHLTIDPWLNPQLIAGRPAIGVEAEGRSCPWRGNRFQCEGAVVEIGYAEVGYRPWKCLKIAGDEGLTLDFRRIDASGDSSLARQPSGLRGSIGKGDFNAALRSESPISLTVMQGDQTIADSLFDDHHGQVSWRVALAQDNAAPRIRLLLPSLTVWQPDGQVSAYRGEICLVIADEVAGP
jgi:hypothetical protein